MRRCHLNDLRLAHHRLHLHAVEVDRSSSDHGDMAADHAAGALVDGDGPAHHGAIAEEAGNREGPDRAGDGGHGLRGQQAGGDGQQEQDAFHAAPPGTNGVEDDHSPMVAARGAANPAA
jgi:hypothetical protein